MRMPLRSIACSLVAVVLIAASPAITGGISDPTLRVRTSDLRKPPRGARVIEPDFKTTLRRMTNASRLGSFGTHIYSQLQAFSADDTYVLLIDRDEYVVRRMSDLTKAPLDTSEWNAPRWFTAESHSIIWYDSNGDATVRVRVTDVDSGTTRTAYTFPAQYRTVASNQSFDELSRDGRWMAGVVRRADGTGVIFTLDLQAGTLGAVLPIPDLYAGPCAPDPEWGEVEPDWIGASPLGRELVVQWVRDGTARCSGLETFDIRTGAFLGRVSEFHDHGDLGVLADGTTEMFMTTDYSGNAIANSYRTLPGTPTQSDPVLLQPMGWIAAHTSCQGPDGVCLVTTSTDLSDGLRPFEGEMFLQYTDGSVLRLAHHRSSACGYWVQPRASISASGRFVIFASDWKRASGSSCGGGNALGSGEAYVVDLDP